MMYGLSLKRLMVTMSAFFASTLLATFHISSLFLIFSLDKSTSVAHMLKFNLSKRRQAPPSYVTISPMNILRIGSKPVTNLKSPSLRKLPKRPSTHTGSDTAKHKSLPIYLRVFLMSVNTLVRRLLMRSLNGSLPMMKYIHLYFLIIQ